MPSRTLVASLAVATAAVYVQEAHAHVYLTNPLAEFKRGTSKSSWVSEFPPPWEGVFKTGAQFAAAAKARGIKDLRSFLEDKGPVCGNSLPDATPKAIPSNGRISLASTIEHAGPCEVWFDDVRAFQNDDCESTFGSATSFAVDFSKCSGSCMLRFYWLGLQSGGKRWQVYKNCVPLKGGSGSGNTPAATPKPADNSTTPATTPATTPKATPAPAPAPAPATSTPAGTTKAPSKDENAGEASGSKCKRLRD